MLAKLAARSSAMGAWQDCRFIAQNNRSSRCHDFLTTYGETKRVRRDISIEEFDGWVPRIQPQRTLDIANDNGRNANVIALQDPSLRGDVADLVRFDAAAILDLDQPPAAPVIRLKDISTDNDPLAFECRFEDWQAVRRSEKLPGPGDSGRNLKMSFCDQVSLPVATPGHFTDRMTAFEKCEGALIVLPEVPAMNLEPGAAWAMLKSGDFALGQSRLEWR